MTKIHFNLLLMRPQGWKGCQKIQMTKLKSALVSWSVKGCRLSKQYGRSQFSEKREPRICYSDPLSHQLRIHESLILCNPNSYPKSKYTYILKKAVSNIHALSTIKYMEATNQEADAPIILASQITFH